MLTAKNLERLIELENKLRSEYQVQLDAKSAEIDRFWKLNLHVKSKVVLLEKIFS